MPQIISSKSVQQPSMPKKERSEGSPSIMVYILAGLLLLGILFGIYKLTFRPAPISGYETQQVNEKALDSLANKCQGDFKKLSPEDQKKVNSMTGGRGGSVIARIYMSKK